MRQWSDKHKIHQASYPHFEIQKRRKEASAEMQSEEEFSDRVRNFSSLLQMNEFAFALLLLCCDLL